MGVFVIGVLAYLGCSKAPTRMPPEGSAESAPCPAFVTQRGPAVSNPGLNETSGIAASMTLPGALWAHNDSGDGPRLFAVGLDGVVRGEVTLQGASAVDWEDMSAAPGSGGHERDLIVADVGDNDRTRGTLQLYRLGEPHASDLGERVTATRFDVRLPEGPEDIEALFVDPVDSAVYLVAKRPEPVATLYRVVLAPRPSGTLVADAVGTIPIRLATGADLSADGSRLAVRNHQHAQLWHRAVGTSIADTVKGDFCVVPLPQEPQGESIAFLDSKTLVLLSEFAGQPIYVLTERDSPGSTK